MEPKIIILGGGKTAFNLYKTLMKYNLKPECFNFEGEYMNKKKIGQSIEKEWKGFKNYDKFSKFFITSETVFSFLSSEDRSNLDSYYFLRDKLNLIEIAKCLCISSVKSIDFIKDEVKFPIAVKPKESAGKKVNFKFKVVKSSEELKTLESIAEYCLFQPYLDPNEFRQIAFAGYFTGDKSSLI
jgi:hypothetical protein